MVQISQLERADTVTGEMELAVDTLIKTNSITLDMLADYLKDKVGGGGGAGGKAGDIGFTIMPEPGNGRMWCDGSFISRLDYLDLWEVITENEDKYVSLSEFDKQLENNGCCAKFGLDENGNQIRLPLIQDVYIKTGNGENAGTFGDESLPNITGRLQGDDYTTTAQGAFYYSGTSSERHFETTTGSSNILYFNASRSSPVYKDGANVEAKHLNLRAFVVVNVSKSTETDLTQELEVVNPWSYGMYMWLQTPPDNASWIVPGEYSGNTFTGLYSWIAENVNNGVNGFKSDMAYAFSGTGLNVWFPVENPKVGATAYSTTDGSAVGTVATVNDDKSIVVNGITLTANGGGGQAGSSLITEYDWQANSRDMNFRTPLKVLGASSKHVIGDGKTLGLTNGKGDYVALGTAGTKWQMSGLKEYYNMELPINLSSVSSPQNTSYGITEKTGESGAILSDDGLTLYFYAGAVLKDPDIINVNGFINELNKRAYPDCWVPSYKYEDLSLGASGTIYTAPADGYFYLEKLSSAADQYISMVCTEGAENSSTYKDRYLVASAWIPKTNESASAVLPVEKDRKVKINYTAGAGLVSFRFIYAKGAE